MPPAPGRRRLPAREPSRSLQALPNTTKHACPAQRYRYYTFVDAGCVVTLYSVKGGKITIDAGSLSDNFKTENDKRWESSGDIAKLETSEPMSSIKADEIDCLYLAGGHGTCIDFPTDAVGALVTDVYAKGKIVGAVCHGNLGLVMAKDGDTPLV